MSRCFSGGDGPYSDAKIPLAIPGIIEIKGVLPSDGHASSRRSSFVKIKEQKVKNESSSATIRKGRERGCKIKVQRLCIVSNTNIDTT